ncbi:MAG: hypothetical protein PHW02_00970 [bacterium]|nr:hypothetical protein [bacterium]
MKYLVHLIISLFIAVGIFMFYSGAKDIYPGEMFTTAISADSREIPLFEPKPLSALSTIIIVLSVLLIGTLYDSASFDRNYLKVNADNKSAIIFSLLSSASVLLYLKPSFPFHIQTTSVGALLSVLIVSSSLFLGNLIRPEIMRKSSMAFLILFLILQISGIVTDNSPFTKPYFLSGASFVKSMDFYGLLYSIFSNASVIFCVMYLVLLLFTGDEYD